MGLDLNRANANNLTRVIISHAHKITILQRLIGTEPISVSADMKGTCRIKNPLIMTSNTTSKDNQTIRLRVFTSGSNTSLTIRFIFHLLLILQFPAILKYMRFLLAVLTK